MKRLYIICILLTIATLACKDDETNVLTVTPSQIDFETNGGSASITIQTDAKSWNINSPSDWLNVSSTSGSLKSTTVTISVSSRSLEPRSAVLTVTAGHARPVEVTVSQVPSDHLYTLTSDVSEFSFTKAGETKPLKITTDAAQWALTTDADWLQFSSVSGPNGSTTISVTALGNTTDEDRTTTIIVNTNHAVPLQLSVIQKGILYPDYNTSPIAPDASGMNSNAVQLAEKIKLGWNLGNTLEAIGGETAWGNPVTTKAHIDLVKASGFNAVRLPCSWDQHMANAATAEIKTSWLNRVKEVVQYCVDNDMYVLLNIHWDGGWLESNVTAEKQIEVKAKQKAFWEQIATHMRDFDEHLMFASANEPHVESATQMAVLNSYHQTFIDAVRSTGGRNSYRVLVIQGPSTDIDKTNNLMNALPIDEVPDRIIVEVHYYTPYQFCLMNNDASWGNMFYYWGQGYHSDTDPTRNATWGEEDDVDRYFGMMKTKFVDKGVPVVLGEYDAMRRSSLTGDALALHLASRAYYLKYVTKQAIANGLLPFYWDTGQLFNRQNNTVRDQQVLDALIEGAGL